MLLSSGLALAAPYVDADIIISGDQYSDVSMLATLPEGPGWIIAPGIAWTAWSNHGDWIEYTVELSDGNWNIGLNAINYGESGLGLGVDSDWYKQFEIKIEIIDLISGQINVPASDSEENNGVFNIDLLAGRYTIRFTWLNDKCESALFLDANLQINSVFLDRVGDYGSAPNDEDLNGLSDGQEIDGYIDLDQNGVDDHFQAEMKCIQTIDQKKAICIEATLGATISHFKSVDGEMPFKISDVPGEMPFGWFTFVVHHGEKSDEEEIMFYFSETLPDRVNLIKYDSSGGSIVIANDIAFNANRTLMTICLAHNDLIADLTDLDRSVFSFTGIESDSSDGSNPTSGSSDQGGCFLDLLGSIMR